MNLLKKLLCAIVMLLAVSCSSTDATGNFSKSEMKIFDIPSRAALRNAENAGGTEMLYFTVLLTQKPDEAIKAKFDEIEVTVISKVGKIITCNAVPAQVRKLAACEFVSKIEIGKSTQIKHSGNSK